jgi:hypothetical protein
MSLFKRFIKEAGRVRTTRTINQKTGKVSTKTSTMKKAKTAITTATRKAKRK